MTIFCRSCQTEKPDVDFYKSRRRKTGYSYQCRDCELTKHKRRLSAYNADADNACCYKCSAELSVGNNWCQAKAKARMKICRSCVASVQRRLYRDDPRKGMLSQAKTRAKRFGLPFALDVDDIVIPEVCPVLGISLLISKGRMSAFSPSLDRFVPELGYVKGNVYVISWRANSLKKDGDLKEFEALVTWMKANHK